MQILYDGQPLAAETPGIAGALDAARARAATESRILVAVLADGEPLPDELLDNPPSSDAEIKRLEFQSETTQAVLLDSLAGATEALAAVKAEQTAAATHLQAGELAEAFGPLARVLETWMMVRTIVGQAVQLGDLDLAGLAIETAKGPVTGQSMIADLSGRLQAVRDAMASEDWGGLSDELEYELSDQADAWSGMVSAMAQQIPAEAA